MTIIGTAEDTTLISGNEVTKNYILGNNERSKEMTENNRICSYNGQVATETTEVNELSHLEVTKSQFLQLPLFEK